MTTAQHLQLVSVIEFAQADGARWLLLRVGLLPTHHERMPLELGVEGGYLDLLHVALPTEALDVVRNPREEVENEPAPPHDSRHLFLTQAENGYRKEEEDVIPEGVWLV